MELIADFLLLAASMCACFYCWMLSNRLRKLKSTRNGIAASLASLSRSVEEAKKAIAHSHMAAQESIEKLGPLVEEAKIIRAAIAEDLLENEKKDRKSVQDTLAAAVEAFATKQAAEVEKPEPQAEAEADEKASPVEEVQEGEAVDDFGPDEFEENIDTQSDPAGDLDLDEDDEDFEIEWKADENEAQEASASENDTDGEGERDVISLEKISA